MKWEWSCAQNSSLNCRSKLKHNNLVIIAYNRSCYKKLSFFSSSELPSAGSFANTSNKTGCSTSIPVVKSTMKHPVTENNPATNATNRKSIVQLPPDGGTTPKVTKLGPQTTTPDMRDIRNCICRFIG
mmetsp:Transcript_6363/g.9963  ORF Transcript_6363/g.9963 Transcript_6363/m.9963 type:complete len:128 (+) Transcript_6363:1461-1844(+)